MSKKTIKIRKRIYKDTELEDNLLWNGKVESFLEKLAPQVSFDLIVTSPPYNIGKEYEEVMQYEDYLEWQTEIIENLITRLKEKGSICWQVGNYVDNRSIWPLDIDIAPIFRDLGLQLRNRIIWRYGHGLHTRNRFSGRYEVVLWFTKCDDYVFNLDPVRIPAKYPGKKKRGEYSSNPKGKNPEDVWDIPNVKSNHVEKTIHPAQFPVGLIEKLVLSMTNPGGLVFDPFAGVGSAGVAAAIHNRKFWGCEISTEYINLAKRRIDAALRGEAKYRPHDKPIFDHTKSSLSKVPEEFKNRDESIRKI